MEFLVGIAGRDYVVLGSDRLSARSIMVMAKDSTKLHPVSTHQVLGIVGENGDCDRLRERIQAESALARYRMDRSWTTKELAWYSRTKVAESLRTRSPYFSNVLIAGVDQSQSSDSVEASLYWMDNLAAMHKMSYAVHGYGGLFSWSLLDAKYRPDMTVDEALDVIKQVVQELQTRFVVQLPDLKVQVIDKQGIRDIEPISG